MKWITTLFLFLIITVGALWYAIGGIALAISTGAIAFLLALLLAGAFGSWWTANLMDRGADIALRSQESDVRRDGNLLTTVSRIYPQGIRDGKEQAAAIEVPQYPALIDNGASNFTITGLPDDIEN